MWIRITKTLGVQLKSSAPDSTTLRKHLLGARLAWALGWERCTLAPRRKAEVFEDIMESAMMDWRSASIQNYHNFLALAAKEID